MPPWARGWWQASDAKWYPPHLHPNVINLPPPPVLLAPPAPPPAIVAPGMAPFPPGYGALGDARRPLRARCTAGRSTAR